ncbi:hypothetical protein MY4038_002198 [Beauveria bassiana]
MTRSRHADVFFFASPRTLSNLLVRLLSKQTDWKEEGYYLHDAYEYVQLNLSSHETEFPTESFKTYLEMMRVGHKELLVARKNAHENGRAFFTKSHLVELVNPSLFFAGLQSDASPLMVSVELETLLSPASRTNPTLLSDETLLSFIPLFLIRHPALVVDSWYRAKGHPPAAVLRDSLLVSYSVGVQLTRALFDWYAAAEASSPASATAACTNMLLGRKSYPIVVDADDLLEGDTVQRLARTIGMDPAQILQQWETQSTDIMDPRVRPFVKDLWASTGIDKTKSAKGLDLEAKFKSWSDLYGVEVGKTLADLTNDQMEGYLWLKSRKF